MTCFLRKQTEHLYVTKRRLHGKRINACFRKNIRRFSANYFHIHFFLLLQENIEILFILKPRLVQSNAQ